MSESETLKRFRALLNYWIEHNKEHSQEFREWAKKAKGLGSEEEMLQAAQEMDKASESLSQALSNLDKKEL